MKHDLTTGTWQDDTGCPIGIILVATSDVPTSITHLLLMLRPMQTLSLPQHPTQIPLPLTVMPAGVLSWVLQLLMVLFFLSLSSAA